MTADDGGDEEYREGLERDASIKESALRAIAESTLYRQASSGSSLSNLGTPTLDRRATGERSISLDSFTLNGDTTAAVTTGPVSPSAIYSDGEEEAAVDVPKKVEDFKRVQIVGGTEQAIDRDTKDACKNLQKALHLRSKYMTVGPSRPMEGSKSGTGQIATSAGTSPTDTNGQDIAAAAAAAAAAPAARYPHTSPASSPQNAGMQASASSSNVPAFPLHRRRPEPVYDPFQPDDVPATPHTIHVVKGIYTATLQHANSSTGSSSTSSSADVVNVNGNGEKTNGNKHAEHPSTSKVDSVSSSDVDVTVAGTGIPTVEEFYRDLQWLMSTVTAGPAKSLSFLRLQLLEARFNLHVLLNGDREVVSQKMVPHRDFYNIRKVDTHVHHSACMNQKHLLRFIKHKLKQCPHEVVSFRDGQFMTLSEVFASLRLTAYDLSVDTLDMHANNTFHRFDRFNLKYNPAGQSRLREIFLKTDNLIAGQYLAEVTREVISDLDEGKYSMVEWRLSIYGRRLSEWDKLARWFYVHRLAHNNVRWMIQVPRLYSVYKQLGEVDCFQDMIDRIFAPLFEVSVNPDINLPLHAFLKTIVGFDSVDDESKTEHMQLHPDRYLPTPDEWSMNDNPPYSYWTYYLWANITSLNMLRASKGLNTFEFRPHCGEAGDISHLGATFLVADKINHGILLRKAPALQYLYYLSQIGIAMSPLSNNKLFLNYDKNPFPRYFAQGLNVSLSTDDPLMLHFTKDALLEEYSVAAQVWKLSTTDQCEIARNSVLQSGFETRFKRHFLGDNYAAAGAAGNDIAQSNVPDIRVQYRHETLESELQFVSSGGCETSATAAAAAAATAGGAGGDVAHSN